jgi:hypothetical protein
MTQGNQIIQADRIGVIANHVLQRQSTAIISGLSSRGIYLQPPDDLTLYLSWERFSGPLTVNISGKPDLLAIFQSGAKAEFGLGAIIFPGDNISIDLKNALVWNSPPPIKGTDFKTEMLEKAFQDVQDLANGNPYLPLLEGILPRNQVRRQKTFDLDDYLNQFLDTLEGGKLDQAVNHLLGMIGLGPGLTPLGDDFILGVLLTLNRWRLSQIPEYNLEELNQNLLLSAREKTTSISFSLFTCAVEGIADERLCRVLDSFFSDESTSQNDLEGLLNWGSSSGIAVLAGMAAALTRLPR